MGDFAGHISIKSTKTNTSYNSSVLDLSELKRNDILTLPEVKGLQSYATVSGILRTEKSFSGIILKGVAKDFNRERFKKFMVSGSIPDFNEEGYNNQVILPEKIAIDLNLKPKDSIVAIFSKEDQKPIYRKFEVAGLYKADIKLIDDLYIIGDINHVRKIQGMGKTDIGGLDVFLDNTNRMDEVLPKIDALIGYKNYAEKITDRFPQIVDWINIFDTNISLIISIMMVVVIINIIMVLLILIIERTNSIGMLKTLGATNGQIRTIFINYTLLIMVPGLMIGNAIGIGLLLIQKFFGVVKLNPENYYVSEVPVELNPIYILMISFGILLISAIALILPSYLISKISPVKAIRYN